MGNSHNRIHLTQVTGEKAQCRSETIYEAGRSSIHNQQRHLVRWSEHSLAILQCQPLVVILAHVLWLDSKDSPVAEIHKFLEELFRHTSCRVWSRGQFTRPFVVPNGACQGSSKSLLFPILSKNVLGSALSGLREQVVTNDGLHLGKSSGCKNVAQRKCLMLLSWVFWALSLVFSSRTFLHQPM